MPKIIRLLAFILMIVSVSAACIDRSDNAQRAVNGSNDAPDVAETNSERLVIAEEMIDAFYSFDSERLKPFLESSPKSAPEIIYYQGWAEGGNYKVLHRAACVDGDSGEVSCAITVEDDPVLALGSDFKVTDTFTLEFDGDVIIRIETSSNDQPIYYQAEEWVRTHMPEVMEGPCRGFFNAGPTPGDCARAMTEGYRRFAESDDFPR